MTEPDLFICSRGHRTHRNSDPTGPPFPVNNEGYVCLLCGMDESGLSFYRRIDSVDSPRYDDRMRMIDEAPSSPEIPDHISGAEKLAARRELATDPDLIEKVEEHADRIRDLIYDDEEDFLDLVESKIVDHFPSMARLHGQDFSDEDFDRVMDLQIEAEDVVRGVIVEKLKPMIWRILQTGDWREKETERDEEN